MYYEINAKIDIIEIIHQYFIIPIVFHKINILHVLLLVHDCHKFTGISHCNNGVKYVN